MEAQAPCIHIARLASIPHASGLYYTGFRFGITHLSTHPFDSAICLSYSYDQTLKTVVHRYGTLGGRIRPLAKNYTHATRPSPLICPLLATHGIRPSGLSICVLRLPLSLSSPGQIALCTSGMSDVPMRSLAFWTRRTV